VLVSAGTDFGQLLARSNDAAPLVVLLRRQQGRRAVELAGLLLANLDDVANDLAHGAIVVIDERRKLPTRCPGVVAGRIRRPPPPFRRKLYCSV
jgi:hypothetical protein